MNSETPVDFKAVREIRENGNKYLLMAWGTDMTEQRKLRYSLFDLAHEGILNKTIYFGNTTPYQLVIDDLAERVYVKPEEFF